MQPCRDDDDVGRTLAGTEVGIGASTEVTSVTSVDPTSAKNSVENSVRGPVRDPVSGRLTGGNWGNSGGKKGRSGRTPEQFRLWCRTVASSKATGAAVREIASNASHPHFIDLLRWLSSYGYGKPDQALRIEARSQVEVRHALIDLIAELPTASLEQLAGTASVDQFMQRLEELAGVGFAAESVRLASPGSNSAPTGE